MLECLILPLLLFLILLILVKFICLKWNGLGNWTFMVFYSFLSFFSMIFTSFFMLVIYVIFFFCKSEIFQFVTCDILNLSIPNNFTRSKRSLSLLYFKLKNLHCPGQVGSLCLWLLLLGMHFQILIPINHQFHVLYLRLISFRSGHCAHLDQFLKLYFHLQILLYLFIDIYLDLIPF